MTIEERAAEFFREDRETDRHVTWWLDDVQDAAIRFALIESERAVREFIEKSGTVAGRDQRQAFREMFGKEIDEEG